MYVSFGAGRRDVNIMIAKRAAEAVRLVVADVM
jgi:hypothetical protein